MAEKNWTYMCLLWKFDIHLIKIMVVLLRSHLKRYGSRPQFSGDSSESRSHRLSLQPVSPSLEKTRSFQLKSALYMFFNVYWNQIQQLMCHKNFTGIVSECYPPFRRQFFCKMYQVGWRCRATLHKQAAERLQKYAENLTIMSIIYK